MVENMVINDFFVFVELSSDLTMLFSYKFSAFLQLIK